MAKEEDTHTQIISAEAVLSRQHPQVPDLKVHAQTVGAETEVISGEPGAMKEVAHAHRDHAEPDLQVGQPGNPNANTPEGVAHAEPDSTPGEEINPNMDARVHLSGAEPEALMDAEVDWLLEEGITGENASAEEDRQGSSCRAARARGQPPCHTGGSEVPHLAIITTTHHFPRLLLVGRSARRDAGNPRTRPWRRFGPAAARHSSSRRGCGTPHPPSA